MQEDRKENTELESTELELCLNAGPNKAFSITPSGIVIREDLTFSEWREGLKLFKWAQLSLKISLSDYIKFGEIKYGKEEVESAIVQMELPLSDVRKAVQINSIPEKIRKYNLSADHYIVLAKNVKDSKAMEKWAKKVVELNMTPSQLKESIRQGEPVDESVAKKNQHGVITIHAIRMEAEIWLRRMGGLNGLSALGAEQKKDILTELQLFADMIEALK